MVVIRYQDPGLFSKLPLFVLYPEDKHQEALVWASSKVCFLVMEMQTFFNPFSRSSRRLNSNVWMICGKGIV